MCNSREMKPKKTDVEICKKLERNFDELCKPGIKFGETQAVPKVIFYWIFYPYEYFKKKFYARTLDHLSVGFEKKLETADVFNSNWFI